jgi:hypothetical protein
MPNTPAIINTNNKNNTANPFMVNSGVATQMSSTDK